MSKSTVIQCTIMIEMEIIWIQYIFGGVTKLSMSVFHICTFVVYFYIGLNLQQHVYLIEASAPKKYMLILPYIRPEKDQSWQKILEF